jgi:hypothetical protein
LIAADSDTILSYGDAAVFETPARRALLNNIGQGDPYFRASEVGVTAVGGLAGEDLADDFAALLASADGLELWRQDRKVAEWRGQRPSWLKVRRVSRSG